MRFSFRIGIRGFWKSRNCARARGSCWCWKSSGNCETTSNRNKEVRTLNLIKEVLAMKGKRMLTIPIIMGVFAFVGSWAISAQDKYTLKVPNGLSFSEFRGYEAWQVVSISQGGGHIAAILGNPAMIKAYLAGVPGNGKPFPDGARMAKIHWNPKKMETFPRATVPGTQHDVDFMVKDSKRFADSGGWGYACSTMTLHPISSRPAPWPASRRRGTTPSAGLHATRP